jgi:hypothetical protein
MLIRFKQDLILGGRIPRVVHVDDVLDMPDAAALLFIADSLAEAVKPSDDKPDAVPDKRHGRPVHASG